MHDRPSIRPSVEERNVTVEKKKGSKTRDDDDDGVLTIFRMFFYRLFVTDLHFVSCDIETFTITNTIDNSCIRMVVS